MFLSPHLGTLLALLSFGKINPQARMATRSRILCPKGRTGPLMTYLVSGLANLSIFQHFPLESGTIAVSWDGTTQSNTYLPVPEAGPKSYFPFELLTVRTSTLPRSAHYGRWRLPHPSTSISLSFN